MTRKKYEKIVNPYIIRSFSTAPFFFTPPAPPKPGRIWSPLLRRAPPRHHLRAHPPRRHLRLEWLTLVSWGKSWDMPWKNSHNPNGIILKTITVEDRLRGDLPMDQWIVCFQLKSWRMNKYQNDQVICRTWWQGRLDDQRCCPQDKVRQNRPLNQNISYQHRLVPQWNSKLASISRWLISVVLSKTDLCGLFVARLFGPIFRCRPDLWQSPPTPLRRSLDVWPVGEGNIRQQWSRQQRRGW